MNNDRILIISRITSQARRLDCHGSMQCSSCIGGPRPRVQGVAVWPLHGHRLRTCCTTPPTDKLATILQLVVGLHQICHITMPEPNISTCQDVGMRQIFVRCWWICCTTSCRIVVSASVGGVRVVEFGLVVTSLGASTKLLYVEPG